MKFFCKAVPPHSLCPPSPWWGCFKEEGNKGKYMIIKDYF